jgi:hypothetical protein
LNHVEPAAAEALRAISGRWGVCRFVSGNDERHDPPLNWPRSAKFS